MNRRETGCWCAGFVGLGLSGAGWVFDPTRLHYAWLASVTTFWGWPIGSIALLLIHRLTGGVWGDALTPALRVGVASTPLLVPFLVPVLLGLSIFPWAATNGAALPNHFYLNTPFVTARLALYLTIWLTLAWLTLASPSGVTRSPLLPAIGLPLLALSFTFATIDLTLSLEPQFNSSIYGLLQGAAAVLFALSIAALPTVLYAPRETLADIGKLMLALVVLWAYLDFMQFLIVWESNLPNEAHWYVLRMHGSWGGAFAILAMLHAMLPIVLLILPPIQRSRRALSALAALLIFTEIIRGWWIVLPEARSGAPWIDAACIAAFVGVGSGWASWTARMRARRNV